MVYLHQTRSKCIAWHDRIQSQYEVVNRKIIKSVAVIVHTGSEHGASMSTVFTSLDSSYKLYFTTNQLSH